MSDLRVKPGDPIRADRWNMLTERIIEGPGIGFPASTGFEARVEVSIKNTSGNDRDFGEVLRLDTYDGPTAENFREMEGEISFEADDPVWHTAINRLVVLAEPIPNNERGRAVLSGLCVVKLTSGTDHPYAMIDDTTINEFTPADSGIATLLGISTHSGTHYGLIQLGTGCPFWRYELTQASQAPATTTAKLIEKDGTEFDNAINLSDKLEFMDDQVSGDKGICYLSGNEFHAIQAICS